jgi:hypothetical protein
MAKCSDKFFITAAPQIAANVYVQSLTLFEGDMLLLRCAQCDSGGDNIASLTATWSKDGTSISDGGTISGTKTLELIVRELKTTDAGSYKCRIANSIGAGPDTTQSVIVTVRSECIFFCKKRSIHTEQELGRKFLTNID